MIPIFLPALFVSQFSSFNLAQKQNLFFPTLIMICFIGPIISPRHIYYCCYFPHLIPLSTGDTCKYLSFIICLFILRPHPSEYLILSRKTVFNLLTDQLFYRILKHQTQIDPTLMDLRV